MQLAGLPPSKYHGGGPCNCGHFSFLGHDLLPHATPLTCVPGPFPPRPGPALALFHPAPGLPALVHPALRLASVPGLLLPGPSRPPVSRWHPHARTSRAPPSRARASHAPPSRAPFPLPACVHRFPRPFPLPCPLLGMSSHLVLGITNI